MSTRRSLGLLIATWAALAGCDKARASTAAPGKDDAASTPWKACAEGALDEGRRLVADDRAARMSGEDFESRRAELDAGCEVGCAPACLELARLSWEPSESARLRERACAGGEVEACVLEGSAATQVCVEQRALLACTTRLEVEAEGSLAELWSAVAEAGAAGCDQHDARACAASAWARCVGLGEGCDEGALAAADDAALLVPDPALVELGPALRCELGQVEAANERLAAACAAGRGARCERRCEALPGGRAAMIVSEERSRWVDLVGVLELQGEDAARWLPALSLMSAGELEDFEALLTAFTPPVSDAAASLAVPEELRERFPALVEALRRSPQLDTKKIRYWFERLPDMSEEQRTNLLESLRGHWWALPGEGQATPASFVEDVGLRLIDPGRGGTR
ncbi:hypothetical protein G6O69_12240 [Pseudenhygromyxa sp. WMMC2535]|uniref:hypothetical protein n=1 Tax=Pseudenhygromyxa sp. WMMC2535 TaxID=2712867 RepID=UPI001554943A|nr:hypothetical protein [Pseudenhygromyxa sp. WMMC2535]NVB38601.1 hypothetical protein [Pseudenhygromyxa sp. WMMC2535]